MEGNDQSVTTAELVNAAESLQRLAKLLRGLDTAAALFREAGSMTNLRDETVAQIARLTAERDRLTTAVDEAYTTLREAKEARAALDLSRSAAAAEAEQIVAAGRQRAADIEDQARRLAEKEADEIVERAQFRAGQIERQAREQLQAAERAKADLEAKMQRLQQQAASITGAA